MKDQTYSPSQIVVKIDVISFKKIGRFHPKIFVSIQKLKRELQKLPRILIIIETFQGKLRKKTVEEGSK